MTAHWWEIIEGDCVSVMQAMPDNCVDAIVTDPPSGIGFMGKEWDHHKGGRDQWIKWMAAVSKEALRVIKPGGHALVWSLPRTSHWTATAWENGGWEIRDRLGHLFGTGYPKSLNLGKALRKAAGSDRDWDGWGTGLKPAVEDWWLCRKPIIGTVADNVLAFRTGGINIEGCRVQVADGDSVPKFIHEGKSLSKWNSYGESIQGSRRTGENSVAGRWPAHLAHDGSPEVVAIFPQSAGQQAPVRGTEPSAKTDNAYSPFDGRAPFESRHDAGSAARFFYCSKISPSDRHEGLDRPGPQFKHGTTLRQVQNTDTKGNNHPTCKSTNLMRWLCRLIVPPEGIVLDPFAGSGSTGKAALLEGFNFIGIENESEYVAIARSRIDYLDRQSQ